MVQAPTEIPRFKPQADRSAHGRAGELQDLVLARGAVAAPALPTHSIGLADHFRIAGGDSSGGRVGEWEQRRDAAATLGPPSRFALWRGSLLPWPSNAALASVSE